LRLVIEQGVGAIDGWQLDAVDGILTPPILKLA
jgi:hypothetical protein